MQNNVAVRNIERADSSLVKELGEHGVATAHEAQGRTGLLHPVLRPIYTGARIGGSAITVLRKPKEAVIGPLKLSVNSATRSTRSMA